MPGVESASMATSVPFGMLSMSRNIQPTGGPATAQVKPLDCSFNMVGEDYFRTLAIPVLRGRSFQPAEASAGPHPVAILDKPAASRLWPGQDALGKHIRMTSDDGAKEVADLEVVGVVGNVLERVLGGTEQPHVYVPFGQQYQSDVHIHLLTTAGGPDAAARFLGAVRQEIHGVDGNLPVLGVKSLQSHIDASIDYWIVRTGARLFTLFGGIALLQIGRASCRERV